MEVLRKRPSHRCLAPGLPGAVRARAFSSSQGRPPKTCEADTLCFPGWAQWALGTSLDCGACARQCKVAKCSATGDGRVACVHERRPSEKRGPGQEPPPRPGAWHRRARPARAGTRRPRPQREQNIATIKHEFRSQSRASFESVSLTCKYTVTYVMMTRDD